MSATSLFRHGNYDVVHADVIWDPAVTSHALPPSLFRSRRPGWWPDGVAWPWIAPESSSDVGDLPAKLRSDAMP